MPSAENKPPALFIIGPTAVGKTRISIELAEWLNGEIVSADSRLFYKGMDIGTDKPGQEERARVPHHLIDIVFPDEAFSLADFQSRARDIIFDIHQRKKLPIVVGGTGQYIRALSEGWQIPKQEPDPELRIELEQAAVTGGPAALLDRLKIVDPESASNIDPQNTRRIVRALEVTLLTGRPFSEQRTKDEPFLQPLIIGLNSPRKVLYAIIDARIDEMIAVGLVNEVQRLLNEGYARDLPAFTAIGYQEIAAYLDGEITLDEAIVVMKRRSRQLVRRQANWFKPADPKIRWHDVDPDPVAHIFSTVQEFLSTVNLSAYIQKD
jgi:tRNA dimethylallyltransferase